AEVGHRGSSLGALEQGRDLPDRASREERARPRPGRSEPDDVRPAASEVSAKTTNRRIVVLAAVFALLLGTTLARAFWLQGIKGAQYAAMALQQHRETVAVPAGRGTISDRSGDPLAVGDRAITVYANPHQDVHAR